MLNARQLIAFLMEHAELDAEILIKCDSGVHGAQQLIIDNDGDVIIK